MKIKLVMTLTIFILNCLGFFISILAPMSFEKTFKDTTLSRLVLAGSKTMFYRQELAFVAIQYRPNRLYVQGIVGKRGALVGRMC